MKARHAPLAINNMSKPVRPQNFQRFIIEISITTVFIVPQSLVSSKSCSNIMMNLEF